MNGTRHDGSSWLDWWRCRFGFSGGGMARKTECEATETTRDSERSPGSGSEGQHEQSSGDSERSERGGVSVASATWDDTTEIRELKSQRHAAHKKLSEKTDELRKTTRSISPLPFRKELKTL